MEKQEFKSYFESYKKPIEFSICGRKFSGTLIHSPEFEQDYYGGLLCRAVPCTPEPTEDEIKDWKNYSEQLEKLDVEEVKKKYKVEILRDPEDSFEW